jgi:transcriptional regulator with XRE-family HTH domain
MERDEAKVRGAALRAYLLAYLPVPDASSITALARKAGLRPSTVTDWWTRGAVPDAASLQRLASALGVDLSDLVAAYQASGSRTWILRQPDLEALIRRVVQETVKELGRQRHGS